MIISFKSKGLKGLFERGDTSRVQPFHIGKLRRILARLHTATTLEDTNFPGANLHALTGDLRGCHSVKVNGNWRVIFRFEQGDVYEVNYDDYH